MAGLFVVLYQCSTAALVSELSLSYLEAFKPGLVTGGFLESLGAVAVIIAVSAAINWPSIRFTTNFFWVFSANALVAFAVFIGYCIPRIHAGSTGRFGVSDTLLSGPDWANAAGLAVFNSAGYDACASVISRVSDPRKSLPKAMVLVSAVLTVTYVATLVLPALATSDDYSRWVPGYFVTLAREVGPEWLARWIFVSCLLTNLQSYSCSLMTASYTLASMSSPRKGDGKLTLDPSGDAYPSSLLPKWFGKTRGEVPRNAIGTCAFLSLLFGIAPLRINIGLQPMLYALIMLTEIACYLRLKPLKTDWLHRVWSRRLLVTTAVLVSAFFFSVQNRVLMFGVFSILFLATEWSVVRLK